MTRQEFHELADWMFDETQRVPFGEISIVIKTHGSAVAYIEQHTKLTRKPTPAGAENEPRRER